MRTLSLFLAAGLLLVPSHLNAQEPDRPAGKLGFATGLARSGASGLTARVEYAPLGVERPLSFRLEAGFRWTPAHRFSTSNLIDGNWHQDVAKGADVAVGATAVLSPSPKGKLAPYVLGGVLAVQEWYSSRSMLPPTPSGSDTGVIPQRTSWGAFHLVGGLGLRARMLGHSFHLEARRYNYTTAFTVGSSLTF
jgi:hypothetical protein